MLNRRSFLARAAAFVAGVRLAIEGAILEPLVDAAPVNERKTEQHGDLFLDHDTLEMYIHDGNRWLNTGPALQAWDNVPVVANGFIGSSGVTKAEVESQIAEGVSKAWKKTGGLKAEPAPVKIQLNGQKIGELTLDTRFLDTKESIHDHVLSCPAIYERIGGQAIDRVVVVPGRAVNFITDSIMTELS
jgi:hypothetical protein